MKGLFEDNAELHNNDLCRHHISEITFTHIKCQIIKFQHRMLDPIHRISHTDRCWCSLQCEVLEICGIYISTQMKQPLSVNRPWVIHCVHWYRTDNRESGAARCTCIILQCVLTRTRDPCPQYLTQPLSILNPAHQSMFSLYPGQQSERGRVTSAVHSGCL